MLLLACEDCLVADVGACVDRALAALSGLEAFNGEAWCERYDGTRDFPGDARNGECGYALEFKDFGERIL